MVLHLGGESRDPTCLSWDGAMIVTSCLLDADQPRLVHGMASIVSWSLPGAGDGGAAHRSRSTDSVPPDERLLRAGAAV